MVYTRIYCGRYLNGWEEKMYTHSYTGKAFLGSF